MGTIKTTNIQSISGSGTVTLGTSGETFSVPSGVTVNMSSATQTGVGGANTPAFQAYLSGTQSISTNTMTKVEFNTEVFDTAGAYDNSSNYRFTPLTAGKYVVYATVFTGGASSGSSSHGGFITNIKKNGSDASYNAFYLYNNTTGVDGTMNAVSVFDMNGSSDYVECFAYSRQNTASVQPGTEQSYFGAYKLIGV